MESVCDSWVMVDLMFTPHFSAALAIVLLNFAVSHPFVFVALATIFYLLVKQLYDGQDVASDEMKFRQTGCQVMVTYRKPVLGRLIDILQLDNIGLWSMMLTIFIKRVKQLLGESMNTEAELQERVRAAIRACSAAWRQKIHNERERSTKLSEEKFNLEADKAILQDRLDSLIHERRKFLFDANWCRKTLTEALKQARQPVIDPDTPAIVGLNILVGHYEARDLVANRSILAANRQVNILYGASRDLAQQVTQLHCGNDQKSRRAALELEAKDRKIEQLEYESNQRLERAALALVAKDQRMAQLEAEIETWQQNAHAQQHEKDKLQSQLYRNAEEAAAEARRLNRELGHFENLVFERERELRAKDQQLKRPRLILPAHVTRELPTDEIDEFLAVGHSDLNHDKLGEGAFGVVRVWRNPRVSSALQYRSYAAKMLNLERSLDGQTWSRAGNTIKNNLKEAARALKKEAKLLLREFHGLDHIVPCSLFRVHGDGLNMTMLMQKMDGTASRLQGSPLMDSNTTLDFIEHCAKGLKHVHDKGYVHLDIKPDNIGYTYSSGGSMVFYLMDFGLTTHLSEVDGSFSAGGTPYYRARETLTGMFGSKADIFSLYVTMVTVTDFEGINARLTDEQKRYENREVPDAAFAKLLSEVTNANKGCWNWADMAAREPSERPSTAAILQRVRILRRTHEVHPEVGGAWCNSRVLQTQVLSSWLLEQLGAQGMDQYLEPHQSLWRSPTDYWLQI